MEEVQHWSYTAGRNKTPPLRLSASTNGQDAQDATSGKRMLRRHIWAMLGGTAHFELQGGISTRLDKWAQLRSMAWKKS